VTPISWLWFWRGFRGPSVTFAVLFASVVLGASLLRPIHHLLKNLGFSWLLVLILPILLFRWLANRELDWMPDPRKRQAYALSILLGSTLIAALIVKLRGH
jgi:hypothetical protein